MRYSLWRELHRIRENNPWPPMLAALCAVMGLVCILLSTLPDVSALADGFLYAAQAFLVLMVVIFTAYIAFGVIRDARNI